MNDLHTQALTYHAHPRAGKLTILPSKPCATAKDLALAYSPGVASPCLEIAKNPSDAYKYTNKGNLVAVISNGTAVLGLGNIGALAGKPVMEGKAVLFQRFAGIDAVDIEVAEHDPERLASIASAISPSFGGINLEDIKAPDCFVVEKRLREQADIPVFHDDQHGTAVVASAGLLNALHLTNRKITDVKIVFSGSGAAAIAIINMFQTLGVTKEQLWLFDSKGLVTTDRTDLNEYKLPYAREEKKSLAEALLGAEVFIGVSKGNLLDASMVQSMAKQPIIFALANPTPEISYPDAKNAIADAIVATGRSDFPNQVNNVLCFPFLFRGALDVRASSITEGMKRAATEAIATLAREPVPQDLQDLYGKALAFGPEYLLPVPFDQRLLPMVATAVARAAMEEGVARETLDLKEYALALTESATRLANNDFSRKDF